MGHDLSIESKKNGLCSKSRSLLFINRIDVGFSYTHVRRSGESDLSDDLGKYIYVLNVFASKDLDKFDMSTPHIDLDVANKLVSLKCLSGTNKSRMVSPIAFIDVKITKHGKDQLAIWKKETRKKRIKKLFISSFVRFFWLIPAAIITSILSKYF